MASVLRYIKLVAKLLFVLMVIFIISTYQNNSLARRRMREFRTWRKALENENMKYILIWSKEEIDLHVLKKEQEAFIENNCSFSNCYVTKDRNLSNIVYTNFDAIIISGRNLSDNLPVKRYPDQAIIFAGKESADNYPVCNPIFDNYFNWTWTYRLDSDIVWSYFTVLDKTGYQIAPSTNPKWMTGFKRFSKTTGKGIWDMKKNPVAWFASNCYTRSKRETFVLKLKQALKWYGMEIDVVGTCGTRQCPLENDNECMRILRRYYFYLAFENSLTEDYVSEKVLRALLHYAVPVVFGGANYSRFLPPGSYINARELGPKKTAAKLASLIMNKTAYLEYFDWHNHYTFAESQKSVCTLCEWLNKGVKKVHHEFRSWWNPANDTCQGRHKRSTIRSKILSMLLGSTCSLDETPGLVSFFKDSGIFVTSKAVVPKKFDRTGRNV